MHPQLYRSLLLSVKKQVIFIKNLDRSDFYCTELLKTVIYLIRSRAQLAKLCHLDLQLQSNIITSRQLNVHKEETYRRNSLDC